jgi:hypothetical protein
MRSIGTMIGSDGNGPSCAAADFGGRHALSIIDHTTAKHAA